jgi:hypothetical protein
MNKPQEGALPYRPARARRLSCTNGGKIIAYPDCSAHHAGERRRLSHEILPPEFLISPISFTPLIDVAHGK